eukprot:TRINITY_DN32983_c0_g1_i1.p1 TRINITY_DN32983_c0_g1~~TRINITY_DN32983_c0_g1_i1.p1  ORF type:complete len:367 (-),score=68.44 TRINITY_DN32983_c0_g1_i1:117-1217(-)
MGGTVAAASAAEACGPLAEGGAEAAAAAASCCRCSGGLALGTKRRTTIGLSKAATTRLNRSDSPRLTGLHSARHTSRRDYVVSSAMHQDEQHQYFEMARKSNFHEFVDFVSKITPHVIRTHCKRGFTVVSHVALSHNHGAEKLGFLLEITVDVSHADHHGVTPLMHACTIGNLKVAETLLSARALVNALDHHGRSALMYAAGEGSITMLNLLQRKNCHVVETDHSGRNALFYAAEHDRLDAVKELITKEADPNIIDNHGINVLMVSTEIGSVRLVRSLLKRNCLINAENDNGDTPLMISLLRGHVAVASALLDHEAKPSNAAGDSAIVIAEELGYTAIRNRMRLMEWNDEELQGDGHHEHHGDDHF